MNASGLAAATDLPGFPADSYLDFALAIPFMQGALFAALNGGQDLARDIEGGFLDRLAMTPLSGAALLAGQLGGALFMGLVSAVLYLVVGLIFGVGIASGVGGALVLLAARADDLVAFACFGTFVALRAGTGEAVQGFFPLFFVLLFLCSAFFPRDLIEQDWFATIATYNPVSYMVEGIRSLVITGWDGQALAQAFAIAGDRDRRLPRAQRAGAAHTAGAHMSSFARTRSVALAVAWRSIHNAFHNPAILLPSVLFPLFFFVAFAGGLSGVQNVPDFDFKSGYTSFQFAFVCIQSAAFGGVFTGFAIAADFEFGFARRLLLAAPNRGGIVAGYMIAAMARVAVRAGGRLRRRAGQRHARRRLARRPARPARAGARGQRDLDAVGRRHRDAPAHDAGRSGHADADLHPAVPRAGLRAAAARRGLGARGRALQPVHGDARGGARLHLRRARQGRHLRRVPRRDVHARRSRGRAAGCAAPSAPGNTVGAGGRRGRAPAPSPA